MDTRTRYISVQAKTIMENQGDAAYEFEIKATEEDMEKLRELFEDLEEYEEGTYIRSHVPGIAYHHDSDNDGYDNKLKEIYSLLAQLGTIETRDQVMRMDLDNLGNWNSS